ncbi:MAG: response regulator [bacterium]|nr:response regulator [bacterium]
MEIGQMESDQPTARVLIVDDDSANRMMLQIIVSVLGYAAAQAVDGMAALEQVEREAPDLVLLDLNMPVMDGDEVLRRLKENQRLRHIPVVMISSSGDIDRITRCIELGADDYLPKPFNETLLKARLRSCLHRKAIYDAEMRHKQLVEEYNRTLERRVRQQVEQIASAHYSTIFALSKLAESRDPDTGSHLERMREYCRVLAERLARHPQYQLEVDREFVSTIYAASPLHDIGKVGIPDYILQKRGRLTEVETRIMQTHVAVGAETLREVDQRHVGNRLIRMGIELAAGHHEKWDGTGYLSGLKGDEIPLAARILALGDVYDAMTSRRCYKEPFTHENSRELIVAERGRAFDPAVVDAFVASEQEFIAIHAEYRNETEPDEGAGLPNRC